MLIPFIFNFNLENSIRKFQDNLEVFTVNRLHKLVVYIYYVSSLGRNEFCNKNEKQIMLSKYRCLLINVEYAKCLVSTL
jgi:hypothetical protein